MATIMYSAHVEVDRVQINVDDVDALMGAFEQYHGAIGVSPRGYASAQISLPAETLAQACATAIAVVSATFGAPAIACEVLTEAEFHARQGWPERGEVSDVVSTTEAAELLGVSRQRVLQLINGNQLPAEKHGRDYLLPRSAVLARLSPSTAEQDYDSVARDIKPRSTRGRS